MINSENTWALWAIIIAIATLSIYLEEKYRWASKISGAIIGLIIAATLSNLHVIPLESPVYDTIWTYVVPLAVAMLLFQCDLRKIWRESGRMVIIFLISSLGTILGAVFGYLALHNLVPALNHIAGVMTGSYIGGGVNFVAVASAFEVPADLISAATVSDNLLMVLYFFILIVIPTLPIFRKFFITTFDNKTNIQQHSSDSSKTTVAVRDIAFTFATAVIIVAISFSLSTYLASLGKSPLIAFISNKYLLVTTLTVLLASLFPKYFTSFKGANEIGTFLIYIFFVVIGIPASIQAIVEKSPLLLLFCAIMIIVNMLVTFGAAKLFRFSIEEAIIASNANIGGPTTAAAMAISKGWNSLVAPAMLVGTLGYIIGTYIGILIGQYLG
ncbi:MULTISPECIES: DUF819 family protein [Gemella]|uniref:DUF819 family protein n=1 Tax=Gemella TaxID=1378 RepID=UPI000931D03F|nr:MULTISPECIES: DUF819 family protein [Gemella]AXI26137.1 DUF819 domain-containing protein [Gemella sp. ND 6198]